MQLQRCVFVIDFEIDFFASQASSVADSVDHWERWRLRGRSTLVVLCGATGDTRASKRFRTAAPAWSWCSGDGCPRNRTRGTFKQGRTPLRTPSASTPASSETCTLPLGYCKHNSGEHATNVQQALFLPEPPAQYQRPQSQATHVRS